MYAPCCLICLCPDVTRNGGSSVPVNSGSESFAKELDVVFILRKLLEVPCSQVEYYLELSGGQHPSEWGISLCARCHNAVDSLRHVYLQIIALNQQFERGKQKLVEIVKSTEGTGEAEQETSYFVEQTRKWIVQQDESLPGGQDDQILREALGPPRLKRQDAVPSHNPKVQPSVSVASTPKFQCSICSETFPISGKLKEHAIIRHPETFFPPDNFPSKNGTPFPLDSFRASCQRLFREQQLESLGNNCFACCHCSSSYFSRPPVWVHMVESHYSEMVKQLLNLLNPHQAAANAPHKAVQGHMPTVFPVVKQRNRRANAIHPPTMRCKDCGTWFGTASSLCRHRAIYCHVRRSLGLLKSTRRAYHRRDSSEYSIRGRNRGRSSGRPQQHNNWNAHAQAVEYAEMKVDELIDFDNSFSGFEGDEQEEPSFVDEHATEVKVPLEDEAQDFEDPLAI